MEQIDPHRYNSTEYIHSTRNINRDPNNRKKEENKKKQKEKCKIDKIMKKAEKNKGSMIDVLVG